MTSIVGLGLLALTSLPVAAYDLPEEMPTRKPGLWEVIETGTVGPNQVKAIRQYCLDAKADRALQELYLLRQELSVVYHDVGCQAPVFNVSGNVLTGNMACRTNSPTDNPEAGQDFHWTLTFDSDTEVVFETHAKPVDVMLLLDIHLVERQRWVGECLKGQKPGDYVDRGFKYNSDQDPNEEQPENIYESTGVVSKMLKEAIEINKRLGPM